MKCKLQLPVFGRWALLTASLVLLASPMLAAAPAAPVKVSWIAFQHSCVHCAKIQESPIARQVNAHGVVKVSIFISATGKVTNVKLVSGNPLLAMSVVMSVRGWHFQPPGAAVVTDAEFRF